MPATSRFSKFLSKSQGLRGNLIANAAGQGWTAVANIAFIPLYIKYLGVEAFGLIGVFAIILSAASLLDGGLTPTLNRELATFSAGGHPAQYARDLMLTVNTLYAVCFIGVCLLALILVPFLGTYWIDDRSLPAGTIMYSLYLMIIAAALRIGEGVQRGALLGLNRHVLLNLLSIVMTTLRAGGVVVPLAFLSPTPKMFFAWQMGCSALSVVAFAVCVEVSLPLADRPARWNPAIVRKLKGFAGGVMGATALGVILTQADKILLVNLVPLSQFGAYALATAVAGGLYQIVVPVSQSYYPVLTGQLALNDSRLADTYHQGSQIVAATVGPPAVILILFARPVLEFWTGNPGLAATTAPLLSLLALGTLCHCLMFLPYMLQLAAGWSTLAMQMNTILVIILFPALLIVIPRAGMVGAAATWFALTGTALLIAIHVMHRRLLPAEKCRWYLHDVALPIGAALATATLCRIFYPDLAGPLARIIALVASCAMTLLSACLGIPVIRQYVTRAMFKPHRD